jgi:hypothetical protein
MLQQPTEQDVFTGAPESLSDFVVQSARESWIVLERSHSGEGFSEGIGRLQRAFQ